jgi:hypothetical protein
MGPCLKIRSATCASRCGRLLVSPFTFSSPERSLTETLIQRYALFVGSVF